MSSTVSNKVPTSTQRQHANDWQKAEVVVYVKQCIFIEVNALWGCIQKGRNMHFNNCTQSQSSQMNHQRVYQSDSYDLWSLIHNVEQNYGPWFARQSPYICIVRKKYKLVISWWAFTLQYIHAEVAYSTQTL